jgi:hypothetical protein
MVTDENYQEITNRSPISLDCFRSAWLCVTSAGGCIAGGKNNRRERER